MTCSGYPLEWFVESIDDYLKCGICGKVLHSPRATSCGHVFCNHCLVSWIEYYGICPNRCGEVELQHLTKAVHIHKRISGLQTRCRYNHCGCSVQVPLAEKHKHEKVCSYRCSTAREPEQIRRAQSFDDQERRRFKRTRKTSGVTARVSRASNRSAPSRIGESPLKMQAPVVRTYKLTRTRPKEPLGLVLMSGAKTPDGTHQNFYVKKVNQDTPAWKSGLEPGDRIIQVDNFDLHSISTQEAVARIKDQTIVTLTVLRGGSPPEGEMGSHYHCLEEAEHIYDEILYTDLVQLSQSDENYPPLSMMSHMHAHRDEYSKDNAFRRNRVPMHSEPQNRRPSHNRPVSPMATYGFRTNPHNQKTPPSGEKSSKDSGLSSGSSGSPHPFVRPPVSQKHPLGAPHLTNSFLDRNTTARHSYRTEREMLKNFLKTQKKNAQTPARQPEPSKSRNCRIEGDYEVEEIYLEKNGTSQLGITLGYDTKSCATGCLYVCEVVPTGLAAKDGRLHPGDLIRRVNGFEVFDAEEAILLFLEQDQDITLTVARKMKTPPSRLELPSYAHTPALSQPEPNFDLLESTLLGGSRYLRRIDSCGSLDSHSHKYATTGNVARSEKCDSGHPDGEMEEPLRMSHENLLEGDYGWRLGSGSNGRRKDSPLGNMSPLACNEFLSQQLTTQSQHSPVNECTFKPIPAGEQRPKTAGDFKALNGCKVARPSSTTPDSRRKVYGVMPLPLARKYSSTSAGSGADYRGADQEPKTVSPPPAAGRVPTNFRTGHLLNRHHALVAENMYSRSESLV